MSCSFISAFRELSNLSCGAVANIDKFSELNKYLHVLRTPEEVLRDLLLRIEKVSQKRLVLVCGSAGDGKSHLLSYLRNEAHLLDDYMVYSDATESDAPNKTAISTLAKRIEAFNDENIDNGGTEKVIIAIKQESGRIYLQLPYGGGAQARQDRGALPDRRSRARARGDRKGG